MILAINRLTRMGARPYGRFVHQENLRGRHEGTGNGQHLLLATTHTACQLAPPLLQDRERLEAEAQVVRNGLTGLRPVGAEQ